MGYFSEKAIAQEDLREARRHRGGTTREQLLRLRLTDLENLLKCMESQRPHNRMDPYYDRWFYEDYIVEYGDSAYVGDGEVRVEWPYTVEGLLRLIAETKAELHAMETERARNLRFAVSAALTGASPDGQYLLTDVFEQELVGLTA